MSSGETPATEPAGRLGWGEKIGYSLGDAGSNFYWKVFEFYLVFYYTDVFGLSAAAVGTMLLVTRITDAITDPVAGAIADRTSTRWGRFRPYLIWFGIPLAVAGVLTFTTPDLEGGSKLVYAYITYSFLMLMYTAVNIPYTALMGVMTANSLERTTLSSLRFVAAFVVTVFVQYYTLSLVGFLGGGDDARGWQLTMVVYGAAAIAMFALCFATTKERIEPPQGQEADVRRDLRGIVSSWPWRTLFAAVTLILIAYAVRGAVSAYYFKYYVGREDLLGSFLVANGIFSLLGIGMTRLIAQSLGKKRGFIVCTVLGGLVFAGLFLASPADIALVLGIQIVSSFVIGPVPPLFFAMYADIADHAEWRTGRRATGLVFASAMFAIKFGAALGGWVLGQILDRSGYVPNVDQSATALEGIVLAISLVPGGILVAAGLTMLFYELDEKTMAEIGSELGERRAGASVPTTAGGGSS